VSYTLLTLLHGASVELLSSICNDHVKNGSSTKQQFATAQHGKPATELDHKTCSC
jgi:hypothetical protein